MVCSYQLKDAAVLQPVPQHRDAVLRAAVRSLTRSQGQGVRPGTEPQRAGAVGPHAARARGGTNHRTRGTGEEGCEEGEREQKRHTHSEQRLSEVSLTYSEFNENRKEPPL